MPVIAVVNVWFVFFYCQFFLKGSRYTAQAGLELTAICLLICWNCQHGLPHPADVWSLCFFSFKILLGIDPRTSWVPIKGSPTELQPQWLISTSWFLSRSMHTCLPVSVGDLLQDALWVLQSADAQVSYTAGCDIFIFPVHIHSYT